MTSTLELLQKALEKKNAAKWQRDLNLSSGAIYTARKRGRLSPTLAGQFAIALGENPLEWAGIAALEAEPDTALLHEIKQRLMVKQDIHRIK